MKIGKDAWYLERFGDAANFPVLFLHGFMGSGKDWHAIIDRMSDDFYCITVDLPGHGKTRIHSGPPEAGPLTGNRAYGMPSAARSIIGVLDRLNISGCHLIGYSMGGRLALYLAVHYPERFRKAIIESASPGLSSPDEQKSRQESDEKLAEKLEKSDLQTFLFEWYDQPIFDGLKNQPQFPKLLKHRLRNDPFQLAQSLRFMGTGVQPSLWPALKSIKIPLLLLVGEFDVKFRTIAAQMAELTLGARVECIPQCGHNTHFQKPEVFSSVAKKFLRHTEEEKDNE